MYRIHRRPSVAFTVTLQHRLKAYQERFEQLQNARDSEREALLAQPVVETDLRGGKARAPSAPPDEMNDGEGSFMMSTDNNGVVEETSIRSDGQVHFYGKTSLYHIDSGEIRPGESTTSPSGSVLLDPESRHVEREEMRLYLSEIDPQVLRELMDTYWCWPHHLHLVLCKKVFLRMSKLIPSPTFLRDRLILITPR